MFCLLFLFFLKFLGLKPFVLLVILVFFDGFPKKTICFACSACLFWFPGTFLSELSNELLRKFLRDSSQEPPRESSRKFLWKPLRESSKKPLRKSSRESLWKSLGESSYRKPSSEISLGNFLDSFLKESSQEPPRESFRKFLWKSLRVP